MDKEILLGKSLSEIKSIVTKIGMPAFTAKQICDWLYKKNIESIDEMSNLSLANRNLLKEHFIFGLSKAIQCQTSVDGTKKYLFKVQSNKKGEHAVESVFIPDEDRATLCVSSQSGCRMGCGFCATASQGFHQHLSANEIINQVKSIPESAQLTNFVFMGMGEPLDNIDEVLKSIEILTSEWGFAYSPRRITVSSVGVLPALHRFIDECQCHLAISLHTPIEEQRQLWMPAQKAYPISEGIEVLRQHDWAHQRRLSFEYIMFKGLNDSPLHAKNLVKMLKGLDCRVNLIPYHKVEGLNFEASSEENILIFRNLLTQKGLFCSIRTSRGQDIKAACGLLATTSIT
ncbi:MAG: 23S rRNA (adenine(2503)-C(2))-methyltransferase RlmN [Bacteroidales bacterium]